MKYITTVHPSRNNQKLFLTLPDFSTFDPKEILLELEGLCAQGRVRADEIAKQESHTFQSLVLAEEEFSERMSRASGPLSHLNLAMQTEEVKKVNDKVTALMTAFSSDIMTHKGLYLAHTRYRAGDEYPTLTQEQKKIIDDTIRDFELSGIALSARDKRKLKTLNLKQSRFSKRFSDNLMDAAKCWKKYISDETLLAGVPSESLRAMRDAAKRSNRKGYKVSLDTSTVIAILSHAKNRALREEVYVANAAKASDIGPRSAKLDNRPILEELLRLAHAEAKLLGLPDHVAYSLQKKMANSAEEVIAFSRELGAKAHAKAHAEYKELEQFAREELGINEIMPWDFGFASERLKEKLFRVTEDELQPYFTATKVFEGMFAVVERLYGIRIVECVGGEKPPVWDPSVRFFHVFDKDGCLRAAFYADLYERTDDRVKKTSGAWADGCMNRRVLALADGIQVPVAYLNCNSTPPSEGKDGQLTHDMVVTLFHEFGHDLHHMLGLPEYGSTNWGAVEWDAIELPSQFMENFCWDKAILKSLTSHAETGLPISDDLCDKLIATKDFHAGLGLVRQVEFSLVDLLLYSGAPRDVETVVKEVRKEVRVMPVYKHDRFPNSFSHIFAGGYSAGYYSYGWAEVYSADAKEAFDEAGDITSPIVGQKFLREVLETSGTRGMRESYLAFRGRMPNVDALLRQRGLR